jgi:hypothetical protein
VIAIRDKGTRRAAILTSCIAALLSNEVIRAQEPHETYRTEFGSEYSDGSSTIVGDSASFTPDDGSVILKIDSGRPVRRAVETLQTRYGYVITYEDPRYTNEDDLQDVAAKVRKDYSSYPPGLAPKLMVPKGGKLTLRLPASNDISPQDLASILQQLAHAQGTSSRGGHFRVEQVGDVFHLIPTEVRDRKGNWLHYDSLLDTPISLPEQDRSESELYQAIVDAVSTAAHVRLWIVVNGGIVIGIVSPKLRTSMGATLEPARNVLMRALQLHRSRRTWAVLHDPDGDNNMFALNVWDFPTKPPEPPLPCADNAVELGPCDANDPEKVTVPCRGGTDLTIDWVRLPCESRQPSWSRAGRAGTSELLGIGGGGLDGGYFEFASTKPVNGRATEEQVREAMTKAIEYCHMFRRHLVVLPETIDQSGSSPALVFRCDRDSGLSAQ